MRTIVLSVHKKKLVSENERLQDAIATCANRITAFTFVQNICVVVIEILDEIKNTWCAPNILFCSSDVLRFWLEDYKIHRPSLGMHLCFPSWCPRRATWRFFITTLSTHGKCTPLMKTRFLPG